MTCIYPACDSCAAFEHHLLSAMQKKCDHQKTVMPSYQDYEKMHENETHYTTFFDVFVRRVVGVRKFDQNVGSVLLSQVVTVTDEAFAHLVHINHQERWKAMARDGVKRLNVPAKFTDGGGGKEMPKEGRNRPGMGWSAEGLKEFDRLCRKILGDRSRSEARHRFESRYRLRKKAEEDNKKRKKREKKSYTDDDLMPDDVFNEMDRDVFYGTKSDAQFLEEGGSRDVLPDSYHEVIETVVRDGLDAQNLLVQQATSNSGGSAAHDGGGSETGAGLMESI